MFYSDFEKKLLIPGFHDPNDIRPMGWLFKPPVWAPATTYSKSDDENFELVIPTVFSGLYFFVANPGVSGLTEPTWVRKETKQTEDGTLGLICEAKNYNLMPVNEYLVAVEYITTHGVTVSSTSFTTGSSDFVIDVLPTAAVVAGEFEITSRITKNTGAKFDATMVFKVGER